MPSSRTSWQRVLRNHCALALGLGAFPGAGPQLDLIYLPVSLEWKCALELCHHTLQFLGHGIAQTAFGVGAHDQVDRQLDILGRGRRHVQLPDGVLEHRHVAFGRLHGDGVHLSAEAEVAPGTSP